MPRGLQNNVLVFVYLLIILLKCIYIFNFKGEGKLLTHSASKWGF